jgi:hypothetical protein
VADRIEIQLSGAKIAAALQVGERGQRPDLDPAVLSIEAKVRRAGKGKRLVIGNGAETEVNAGLVELIKEASPRLGKIRTRKVGQKQRIRQIRKMRCQQSGSRANTGGVQVEPKERRQGGSPKAPRASGGGGQDLGGEKRLSNSRADRASVARTLEYCHGWDRLEGLCEVAWRDVATSDNPR